MNKNGNPTYNWLAWSNRDDGGVNLHVNRLMQERRKSIAYALELRLSCTSPSISYIKTTIGMSATPEHSIWLVLQHSWIICIYFRAPDYRIRDKDYVDKLQLT